MIHGKRIVRVIAGSDSDYPQMGAGLPLLNAAHTDGLISWNGVEIASIHWNTLDVIEYVRELGRQGVDIIIIGAGAANHITGTADAFLRRTERNAVTHIIGVAFESTKHPEWGETAERSIIHVPGTAVIYDGYRGRKGFTQACLHAIEGNLPEIILPTEFREMRFDTWDEALIKSGAKKA